jgi:TolB protein
MTAATATRATDTPTPTATIATSTPVPPVTYIVQQGDTLFEIALRFDVTLSALVQANDITDPTLIRPGLVLIIPVPGATVVASTGSTPTLTPIVAETTATSTSTATPTPSGPTPTPTPTRTRAPTPTPTPPPSLEGKIAFTVWDIFENRYDLYISNIDGSGRNLLGNGFRQPQLRQDGAMLVANGDGAPNYEHLVRMNTSGGELIEISQYSEDSYPTWSPTGDIVAFSSTAYVDRESRLGIVNDIYGVQQDWIRVGTTEVRGENPFWMPDGRVVYHGCDFLVDHAVCGLFVVPSGGGAYRRLTTDSSDTSPAGSGSTVAFMSARDGNWEVYAVNMDGSGLTRLTNNSTNDGLPTWSPDGKSIAFVSNRSGAWAIWVMDASGDNQRKLFDLGGGYGSGSSDWIHERISWSP